MSAVITGEQALKHLSPVERAALHEFLNRLRTHYAREVEQVTLFGSKARGDDEPESDLDVLIVVNQRRRMIWHDVVDWETELLLKYGTVISSLIMGHENYEWHRAHRAPLYRNIEREGIDLWTNTPAL